MIDFRAAGRAENLLDGGLAIFLGEIGPEMAKPSFELVCLGQTKRRDLASQPSPTSAFLHTPPVEIDLDSDAPEQGTCDFAIGLAAGHDGRVTVTWTAVLFFEPAARKTPDLALDVEQVGLASAATSDGTTGSETGETTSTTGDGATMSR